MEENGGKRGGIGEIGGNGEIAGIAHGTWVVEGCGGMRLRTMGQKMGEKWEKNGTKYPFFTAPFLPFSRRSWIFPTAPFVNISSPHSPAEKWASADACLKERPVRATWCSHPPERNGGWDASWGMIERPENTGKHLPHAVL